MANVTATNSAMTTLFRILMFVAIIGAINWGLIGLFNWNLVDALFGGGTQEETSAASRVVYVLVGIAGLAALVPLLSRNTAVSGPGPRHV